MTRTILALVALATFLSTAQASAAAVFTPLGDLPGGIFQTAAQKVSADGSTVVGQSQSGSGGEAFVWTASTGMLPLGDIPGGAFGGVAYGVSGDGSVIAGFGKPPIHPTEAVTWTGPGEIVQLGDLPGGIFRSSAGGISDDGSTVVGWSISSGDGRSVDGREAFRWTAAGGMVGLGDLLPGGTSFSVAWDASADGSIIIGSSDAASGREAFLWDSVNGMSGLGDLPGGEFSSNATGVSADGSTVVGTSMSSDGDEAFIWNAAQGMVGLGDLFGGEFYSHAIDVSGDGSVAVGYGTTDLGIAGGEEAFIWDSSNGMRRLQDVLTSQGADLSGWQLSRATSVTPDGRTIAGVGVNPSGAFEGFVATIPEPSTALLLALGLVAMARRRSSLRVLAPMA